MRLADYVMSFLEAHQVKHIFMLSGGGMMYLADALGRSGIEYICCHHEQAAGIAAQSYAMTSNSLGVCMVTTGPGGTNALTAAGAAYMDSTPVLFLSGQVKTADFALLRSVRQFGAQENNIIAMAKPVTKYAVTVLEPEKIRCYLEKAVYLALHGRRGPVWLDIPLDIQNAQINPDELSGFDPTELHEDDITAEIAPDETAICNAAETACRMLSEARRPLFLVGHGAAASEAYELFREILEKLRIPVETTWRAVDIMDDSHAYYFGSPGLQARRYANLILQGSDLLIVLGSRLDNMITAFNEQHFAYQAKKIIVDIDKNESAKLDMPDVMAVTCSVRHFLTAFRDCMGRTAFPDYADWVQYCQKLRTAYPLAKEKQSVPVKGVDLYQLAEQLSEHCTAEDVVVISSTSRCNTAGYLAFRHRKGQKTVSSMGFGSMGFALPSVAGGWFASGKKRVVMLEGDGSFQLNLQELQTIVHCRINAKMFIFRNEGYAAIATMQDRNFGGFHVGSGTDSGLSIPDTGKIAAAYGIPFYCIQKNEEIPDILEQVFLCSGPVLCEFIGSMAFDEIPKCISSEDSSGRRVSAALENPYPFLPAEELARIYAESGGC